MPVSGIVASGEAARPKPGQDRDASPPAGRAREPPGPGESSGKRPCPEAVEATTSWWRGGENLAESTTVAYGGRPDELGVPFNGIAVLEARAREDGRRPDRTLNGVVGRGWNGGAAGGSEPGAGESCPAPADAADALGMAAGRHPRAQLSGEARGGGGRLLRLRPSARGGRRGAALALQEGRRRRPMPSGPGSPSAPAARRRRDVGGTSAEVFRPWLRGAHRPVGSLGVV